MVVDLSRRAAPSEGGRLLDLACGTGQLAYPLGELFAEVWAVDAEPDMTEVVPAKADAVGAGRIRAVTGRAEELDAEPGGLELIVIGNAFHRPNRSPVARRARAWLKPGGCLAPCWPTSPWAGPREWQRRLDGMPRSWRSALGAAGRIPPGWAGERRRDPDHEVLARAGFDDAGRHEFSVEHHWTMPELAGHIRSTSFLPPSVLADRASVFDPVSLPDSAAVRPMAGSPTRSAPPTNRRPSRLPRGRPGGPAPAYGRPVSGVGQEENDGTAAVLPGEGCGAGRPPLRGRRPVA
ncbi:class I SAM-dependent methyltransferase [Streptomyces sp. NPDC005423]|uniref:class I SAM-dependent methyltransferase n=1 Tax=Streptomyces sp. NPDC005423 TaxID=3155343 RepID=UPI0033A4CC2F